MACEILLKSGDQDTLLACSVKTNEQNDPSISWLSVDIIISPQSRENLLDNGKISSDGFLSIKGPSGKLQEIDSSRIQNIYSFFIQCITRANSPSSGQKCLAKIIIPRHVGYLVRTDIFQLRMKDCPGVEGTISFANPEKSVGIVHTSHEDIIENLVNVLESSLGAVILSNGVRADILDLELRRRFSFPWLRACPRPKKTLALVEGGRSSPDRPGVTSGIYLTAKALGIDLVVLDSPGHWSEGPGYAHWRKAFVPLDLATTNNLSDRIVKAVREYGSVDGIISFCDMYAASIAMAAQVLSLPTAPPSAYEIVTDKFKTSIFEGHKAFLASSLEEAEVISENECLDYPMIVKPCNGWCSEGVTKVHDNASLLDAVRSIDMDRHGKEFVIEKYCDGPEVDANFILLDGEVLFFEVSDDIPKGAELDSTSGITAPSNFHELANVLPSNLPGAETDMLRDALHQTLLRLGIRSGFFHLEARVQDSSMEYITIDSQKGIVDLATRGSPAPKPPSAWLIEINPRPPGIVTSQATRTTYGVDYWGISMLTAIAEKESVRALAVPFATGSGAQYWCAALHIPADIGGTFDSDDVFVELASRCPDLAAHISNSGCFLRRGDNVPSRDTGLNPMVGYVTIYSQESRQHLLELARSLRENIKYSII